MSFNVLVPLTITDAMLVSSTVAEPSPGETAWVSGGTFTLGQEVIRSTTHKVYSALIAHAGRTVAPELDPNYWNEERPTNRWAPFDMTISTACAVATTCTYVLRPGFFNAIRVYGLSGANISLWLRDAPGGAVVFMSSQPLINDPLDWYDWAFGVIKQKTKAGFFGLTPYADPELTITITAGAGVLVGAGMISIGDYRDFLGGADWGGVEYGATAELVNLSRIEVDKFRTLKIVDGRSASDMRIKVVMPRDAADYFFSNAREVLSTPAGWVATDAAGYEGLDVFGLGSGSMSYDSHGHAVFSGYVKGIAE